MTTLTTIEKAAKLMGCEKVDDMGFIRIKPDGSRGAWFNPYTSKSDLIDVICSLKIMVTWSDSKYWQDWSAIARYYPNDFIKECWVQECGSEQSALAHAVMAVVEQIYDAKFGKDGE